MRKIVYYLRTGRGEKNGYVTISLFTVSNLNFWRETLKTLFTELIRENENGILKILRNLT